MFSLSSFTLALSAASAVTGLVIPRLAPPAGWRADILEPYADYNARYMAIGCKGKQDTPFFDDCCHPLKSDETVAKDRPDHCQLPSSASVVKPSPTAPVDEEDVDCDDEDHLSSVQPATPTHSQVPPAVTSNIPAPVPSTKAPTPTISSTKAPSTPTSKPPPPPENNNGNNNGAEIFKGGFATYYLQNGAAGACGNKNPDSAFIVAMDYRRYGNLSVKSPLCGMEVEITNTRTGKSVRAKIADACPTCENSNSIDLSRGAFNQIATEEEGLVPISWKFL